MRIVTPLILMGTLILVGPVSAGTYKEAINGLMQASYRHVAMTYACQQVAGASWYRESIVTAENSLRATGMPTDLAISTVAKMISRIEAATSKEPRENLVGCSSGIASTKQEVRAWREELLRSQN